MAETRSQAISRLKLEFPTLRDSIGGVSLDLDTTSYNQRIGEWADNQIAAQVANEDAAARAVLVQQFVDGMASLRTDLGIVQAAITGNTTLTPAQVRIGLRDLLQSMTWVGDRIADGTILIRK